MRDLYAVLAVSRTATPQEIKSAFRKAALLFHPDVNHGDKSKTHEFKVVTDAYRVLSNPAQRKHYDSTLPREPFHVRYGNPRYGGGRDGGGPMVYRWDNPNRARSNGKTNQSGGGSSGGSGGGAGGHGGSGKGPGQSAFSWEEPDMSADPPPYRAPPPKGQATHDDSQWRHWHYGDDAAAASQSQQSQQQAGGKGTQQAPPSFADYMAANHNFQYYHRQAARMKGHAADGAKRNPLAGRQEVISRMRERRSARKSSDEEAWRKASERHPWQQAAAPAAGASGDEQEQLKRRPPKNKSCIVS